VTDVCRRRTIAATPAAIWQVLADFGAIGDWAGNVDHSCLLHAGDTPAGVGTARRVQVGRNVLVERIVESEAPRALAYDLEGFPPRVRNVRNRWLLEPLDDTRTEVGLTSSVDLGPRPPQQVAARILGRVLAKQSDVMLAGLADRLENPRG
jgi:hypothetical protein